MVKAFAGDLWVSRCQKTSCQSLELRVSAAAGRCVCRPPPRALKPQPRPSDVCVSSLMKKFWYLGETLLSSEQTLPPPCPQPSAQSHCCPTQPKSHQASGFSPLPVKGTPGWFSHQENPQSFHCAGNISGNTWWLTGYFASSISLLDAGRCQAHFNFRCFSGNLKWIQLLCYPIQLRILHEPNTKPWYLRCSQIWNPKTKLFITVIHYWLLAFALHWSLSCSLYPTMQGAIKVRGQNNGQQQRHIGSRNVHNMTKPTSVPIEPKIPSLMKRLPVWMKQDDEDKVQRVQTKINTVQWCTKKHRWMLLLWVTHCRCDPPHRWMFMSVKITKVQIYRLSHFFRP